MTAFQTGIQNISIIRKALTHIAVCTSQSLSQRKMLANEMSEIKTSFIHKRVEPHGDMRPIKDVIKVKVKILLQFSLKNKLKP